MFFFLSKSISFNDTGEKGGFLVGIGTTYEISRLTLATVLYHTDAGLTHIYKNSIVALYALHTRFISLSTVTHKLPWLPWLPLLPIVT